MALPKKFHFTSKIQINNLFSNSKKRTFPLFSLLFKKNLNNELHLVTLLTKKVDKRSTQRNTLRRKFNQSLQQLLKKHKFHAVDIAFIPKKEALIKDQKEIEVEIFNALKKEGIINV